jgi:hypothetical protein
VSARPDAFGSLPESERARLAAAVGGKFIGDGIPDTAKALVRERDGSWWVNVVYLADWFDARADDPAQEAWAPAWRGAAKRLRETVETEEAKLQAAMGEPSTAP